MSRTFRRKNYITENGSSWDRQGRRRYGDYAKRVYIWIENETGYVGRCWSLREPTEAEVNKEFKSRYGESSSNCARGPSPENRQKRERAHRRFTTRELYRFTKFDDYEPIVYENPPSCLWDWD
jgi:hypothetical protein